MDGTPCSPLVQILSIYADKCDIDDVAALSKRYTRVTQKMEMARTAVRMVALYLAGIVRGVRVVESRSAMLMPHPELCSSTRGAGVLRFIIPW